MTYDWVYLCGDPRKLELTLKFLPERMTDLRTMKICWMSHLDPAYRDQELSETASRFAKGIQWRLVDLSDLEGRCPTGLQEYFNSGRSRCSLAVKLLLPMRFNTPFLYTDDDVLVPKDPIKYLGPTGWCSKGLARFAGERLEQQEQLAKAFGLEKRFRANPSLWYDDHALDAGVWWMPNSGEWAKFLFEFAACPYIQDLTPKSSEFRRMDQRFLTCFGIVNKWEQLTIRNCFAPPSKPLRDNFFDVVFIHYKTPTSKEHWMKRFQEYLDANLAHQ